MAAGDARVRRLTAAAIGALAWAGAARAQEGNIRITAAAQAVAADPDRRAGQPPIEPDLGLSVYQPGLRFGALFADVHAVRRDGRLHAGRSSIGLRDVRAAGMVWSLTGGDDSAPPALADFSFANLSAPQLSFAGASLSGFGPRASIRATAGRTTALRNIFGSDPQALGQDVRQLRATLRLDARVELLGRASRVRTRDAAEFSYSIAEGDDVGAGARIRVTPTLELSADAGSSSYRRRGATRRERSATALAGLQWAAPRGWLQLNAQRFAPGYFAVVNTPYLDRAGAFAAAEYELWPRLRVFGGFEAYRTNLDPAASAAASSGLPRGVAERGYAGARLHVGGRTFATLRAEDGDRSARPVDRTGGEVDSDTGVVSADLQTGTGRLSTFLRYERREYVERVRGTGAYTQHTSTAQVFGRLGASAHLFGSAMLMRRERHAGGGQTFWQTGGGLQWKLPRRQLWLRSEALYSRSEEWPADESMPRHLLSAGLSGQLTPRTALAFDVALERTPFQGGTGSPWLARSMLRLMHTMPTGSARVADARGASMRRARGSGSLSGIAFADWNGNGTRDADEEVLGGVPFFLGAPGPARAGGAQVSTGPDGQFAFVGVPLGRARVALDLAALPVDFDPPETIARDTEVRKSGGERLAFGLIPLGTIAGAVLRDENGDGVPGDGDAPLEAAVVQLDAGSRSEQTHDGRFRFEAVRPGAHEVTLLAHSLPEGAAVAGETTVVAEIARGRLTAEVVFLVKLEKRPEIRRTFPPRAAGAPDAARAKPGAPMAPGPSRRGGRRASGEARPAKPGGDIWYAVQVAAMRDRVRARALVLALNDSGIDAYLSEDADGLAKVRIGSYRSEEEAVRRLAEVRSRSAAAGAFVARIGG